MASRSRIKIDIILILGNLIVLDNLDILGIFRIPENVNYYSENDYKRAEKKFVKFCLKDGGNHFSLDFK